MRTTHLAALLATTALLSGCVTSIDSPNTTDSAPAEIEEFPNQVQHYEPATTATPQDTARYAWITEHPHEIEPETPLFAPCDELSPETLDELGLHPITQPHAIGNFIYSCSVDSDDLDPNDRALAINVDRMNSTDLAYSDMILGHATDTPIPGAFYADATATENPGASCSIFIDTPRGRLVIDHTSPDPTNNRGYDVECPLVRDHLEKLVNNPEVQHAIWGTTNTP